MPAVFLFSRVKASKEEEAATVGASVVEKLYPDLADVKPGVVQSEVQGHRICDVAFPMGIEGDNTGFTRMVIIAIDTDSETFSIFESN